MGAVAAAEFDANVDLAEWHVDSDHSLYVDSSFSYGDDAQMLVAKLTAGASVGAQLDEVDGQLLYARAIGRGFAVLAGVRHEFVPGPRWSYAAFGIEGRAIKNLAVESYAFLSQKGDLTGEVRDGRLGGAGHSAAGTCLGPDRAGNRDAAPHRACRRLRALCRSLARAIARPDIGHRQVRG